MKDGEYGRITASLLLVIVLLCGCGANKAEQEAQAFVQDYCSILQDAYARADLNVVCQMATQNEVKKLVPVIQVLKATENSMKTEIKQFKIKKAKVSDDQATVRTSERWRYWWVDQKSGSVTKPEREESYDLEYNLLKVNGRWRLDHVKNLNE